jgi:Zn-dependent protease
MEPASTLLIVAILIISVVIHEVAHGYAALALGDKTALYAGRLTLNPLKHLDLFGSVILPLLLSFSGFVFGWAKPVPYNPYNLRNRRWGELVVAIAGPISNILLATVFALAIRFVPLDQTMLLVAVLIVQVNIVLAIFNMMPIPPLDGSKVLFALFPNQYGAWRDTLERWGMLLVIVFIFFLWPLLTPIVDVLFTLLTGLAF